MIRWRRNEFNFAVISLKTSFVFLLNEWQMNIFSKGCVIFLPSSNCGRAVTFNLKIACGEKNKYSICIDVSKFKIEFNLIWPMYLVIYKEILKPQRHECICFSTTSTYFWVGNNLIIYIYIYINHYGEITTFIAFCNKTSFSLSLSFLLTLSSLYPTLAHAQ